MTAAAAIEANPYLVPEEPAQLVALARSFGRLRLVDEAQAPVVRAAAEHDRRVLPRWQRHGDGIHEWAEPQHYTRGRAWVRTGTRVRDLHGRTQWRSETHTGTPHVNWRSRDHWLEVVVPLALRLRPEALATRRGIVAADRFLDYCRTLSLHAHESTGRRCIVRVDRLAELLSVSKSTVQRCQAAAEALGLYVVMSPGRMLTVDETYRARQQGSCQRGMANEAALVIPAWLPRKPLGGRLAGTDSRRHDTPTSGRYSKSGNLLIPSSFGQERRSARRTEPPPAARHLPKRVGSQNESGSQNPRIAVRSVSGRVYDPRALDVARGLTEALPWLRNTRPGRLEPMLRRFVRCRRPWAPRDVVAAIDEANRRLGRASMTRDLVKNPPALLAKYLRDLDVDADHPRAWMDVEAFQREPVSEIRARNRVLLETHRGSVAGPATRAAAVKQIRADLEHRRDQDSPTDQ